MAAGICGRVRPMFAAPVRTLALLLAAVALLGGCATVRPSERETLSRPEMNPQAEAMEEKFQSHVESAREGGFGGHGAAGGGCGCG
jgi:hypothetical protein